MDADKMDLSRRALLASAGSAVGALGLATVAESAEAALPRPVVGGEAYFLRNVRLETGYERDGDEVVGTRTELRTVRIENGLIAAIMAASEPVPPGAESRDGGGLLMLPSFRDMHIHLDKTFYGGPWRPPRKRRRGIPGQIELERKLLPELLPTLEERAEKLVALLQGNGTTFARSHCNVDPVIGTRNVEHLMRALERKQDTFGHEIVAFPQHGLVSVGVEKEMRQAMSMGVAFVGGIDPTALDGALEASVDLMMQIAVDHRAGVDIHLHEPGESGIAAIRRIADTVEREKSLKGRVTISHAFSLASLPDGADAEMAARLSELGISVASMIPIGRRVMPIPVLESKGVKVFTGTDSVVDHWSVFGSGDVLEKAKLAAQLYGWADEHELSQALRIATAGPTPLSRTGEQLWPKVGDPADCVLVPASSAAEAVARLPLRRAVLYRGVLVAGSFQTP